MKNRVKVWDLPTRLFHWTLALSIPFMWFSANTGGTWLNWHLRVGLLIVGLIVFRLVWGFIGSDTARFVQFVRGPSQIRRYLTGQLSENEQPGHNPLGALMVLALLGAVALQLTTGLFASDQNTFTSAGFLNHLVSEKTGDFIRSIHVGFFNVLVALIVIHVGTVMLYKFLKKHDLIKAMIYGHKDIVGSLRPLRFAGLKALVIALVLAFVAVCVILYFA